MDPDANLREALEISVRVCNHEVTDFEADRLAELIIGLNAWIIGGGFLPKVWSKANAKRLGDHICQSTKPSSLTGSGQMRCTLIADHIGLGNSQEHVNGSHRWK